MNEKSHLLQSNNPSSHDHSGRCQNVLWNITWAAIGAVLATLVLRPSNSPSSPAHTLKGTLPSKYSSFQSLGFQIYTGGAPVFLDSFDYDTGVNSTTTNKECIGRESFGVLGGYEHMCYIGLSDPIKDVTQRLKIMRNAVEKAYEESTKDSSTLKIFVAPEFYFRGLDGAYRFKEDYGKDRCGAICVLLRGLEEIVADKRFEDWLFLFGTAIASETLPSEDEFDYTFYNFAPVYRGFDPATNDHHGKRFLLPKRYVSNIDFLTPRRHYSEALAKELVDLPLSTPEHETTVVNPLDFHQNRYDHHMWSNYKQELTDLDYTMIDFGWMKFEGITMTMEICFDHKKRTALTTYLADMVTGSKTLIPSASNNKPLEFVPIPRHQAQLSLVSSAGMQVDPASLALMSGGTIFLQDGLWDGNSVMTGDAQGTFGCAGDTCLEFDGGTEAVVREAMMSEHDVFFDHELVSSFKKYPLYDAQGEWLDQVDNLFSTKAYQPMIAVYAPAKIATVATKY